MVNVVFDRIDGCNNEFVRYGPRGMKKRMAFFFFFFLSVVILNLLKICNL